VYNQKGELCGFQSKPAETMDWNPWLLGGYSYQPEGLPRSLGLQSQGKN
jgi:hypothetical protein